MPSSEVTIYDLLFVKFLVAERVREGGTLILNADDPLLVRLAEQPRVAEGLLSYTGAAHNAGRGHLYRVGGGYELVDYGHNPKAFAAVGRTLNKLGGGRLTGIIGVPGDRDDEVIRQAGRAAARHFDRLIIREDTDLRGRKQGAVAQLLYQAAEEAMPGIGCRVVADEGDALELAIGEMQAGEIVVIFYDQLAPVLEVLEGHHAAPVTTFSGAAQVGTQIGAVAARFGA